MAYSSVLFNIMQNSTALKVNDQQFFFFFFRLLPLSLRHFRRVSPFVLIKTRAVSEVGVAGSRVKTSVSLQRATCRVGHIEAVFFSPDQQLIDLLTKFYLFAL